MFAFIVLTLLLAFFLDLKMGDFRQSRNVRSDEGKNRRLSVVGGLLPPTFDEACVRKSPAFILYLWFHLFLRARCTGGDMKVISDALQKEFVISRGRGSSTFRATPL